MGTHSADTVSAPVSSGMLGGISSIQSWRSAAATTAEAHAPRLPEDIVDVKVVVQGNSRGVCGACGAYGAYGA